MRITMLKFLSLPDIYEVIKEYNDGHWLYELKGFMKLRQTIYRELIEMSPKYYWKIEEFSINDMDYFFTIASEHERSYYYTNYILQELITIGDNNLTELHSSKPFTLTEMHYAKCVLRYLKHCYLAVKWSKNNTEKYAQINSVIPPEKVVNFFLQWLDTVNFHHLEDDLVKLQEIAEEVNQYLSDQLKTSGSYTAEQIFSGVSHIFFRVRGITMTPIASLDTLDIKKVWDNRLGNQIVVFVMYQAVASRLGVQADLVVFPNHLFIEWLCLEENIEYTVHIEIGEIEAHRVCPYTHRRVDSHYKYCPDYLLQCLHLTFMSSSGAERDWHVSNATDLLGFLGKNYPSPYLYLFQNSNLIVDSEINMKNLKREELPIIFSLFHLHAMGLNAVAKKPLKVLEQKRHHSSVLYAVGMICCHKYHEYQCIVRGWDRVCSVHWPYCISNQNLIYGFDQPYYRVIATDQSERYIPQEHLLPVPNPTRMKHLEDLVAQGFTHFDGFCYVLNDEKRLEYPDENLIVQVYKQRYQKMD
ncbi:unnamed protein product, partial [Iphiclides podalirius]